MESEGRGFSRQCRLLDGDDFRAVFSANIRVSDQYWTILVGRAESPHPGARLGLAISKKNARRAVDRNTLKRLVRESFRIHRSALGSVDIVVMAKRDTAKADKAELHSSLRRLWSKVISRCARS
ncbi:MAG TPA: ribonuclease P protein component [Gammaproteobacteria bacterium]|nr:ribonuclease P protein component [Gammaproteobacteria bacterium]